MSRILSFREFSPIDEELNFYKDSDVYDAESEVEMSESEMLSIFLGGSLYEAAPKGNTVKGGLFDLNDQKTYQSVKNVKEAVIKGVKYTFLTISSGMQKVAQGAKAAAKAGANFLLNLAKFTGKVVIFTVAGAYVVTEAIATGLLTAATSIVSYVGKGAMAIGASLVNAFKSANEYFKKLGAAVFNTIKTDVKALGKAFMSGLYAVANKCAKAAEAVSALTVGAYRLIKTSFKNVANFAKDCIYGAASAAKVTAIKIGQKIGDFYNKAVETAKKFKDSIIKNTKAGAQYVVNKVKGAVNTVKKVAVKAKTAVVNTVKNVANKIANTASEIGSHIAAAWNAFWDHETYQGTGQSIFESYAIIAGEKYYVLPESTYEEEYYLSDND
jgi:hypothetical protein